MFKRILFFAVLAMPGIAQVISSVRGEVASDEPLTGNRLVVNLMSRLRARRSLAPSSPATGASSFAI